MILSIYCSYMFFILDVLYCYHITFYFCNQPSYINIKFTLIIFSYTICISASLLLHTYLSFLIFFSLQLIPLDIFYLYMLWTPAADIWFCWYPSYYPLSLMFTFIYTIYYNSILLIMNNQQKDVFMIVDCFVRWYEREHRSRKQGPCSYGCASTSQHSSWWGPSVGYFFFVPLIHSWTHAFVHRHRQRHRHTFVLSQTDTWSYTQACIFMYVWIRLLFSSLSLLR